MDDIKRCPCCKTCQECPYFKNVVNVKTAGLLIYCFYCEKDMNVNTAKNESSTEMFILHNTKNKDITSEKLIPKLGQYKKCPRCKYILEHVEKILLNIPTIKKLDVLGICDKCRTKDRKGVLSCKCNEVAEKFVTMKNSDKQEVTKSKQKHSKLQKLLNRFSNKDEKSKTSARATSATNLNNICHVHSKEVCIPGVEGLIIGKNDIHGKIRTEIEQKTHRKIRFAHKTYSDSELVGLDTDIFPFRTDAELEKHDSDLNVNNLTTRDLMLLQSFTKTNKKYPSRHITLSEESIFNYHDLIDKLNLQSKLDSLHPSTNFPKESRLGNEPSILDLIDAQNHIRDNKKDLFVSNSSILPDGRTSILKTKVDMKTSPDAFRKYKSEAFSSSLLSKTDESLRKDFSYFFIKEDDVKPVKKHKSSSELIKDTHDMLIAREEDIKRKHEEDRKRKIENFEKKRKLREDKIILSKESKTDLDKERKDSEKSLTQKSDVSSKMSIEKVSKDISVTADKSRKGGIKTAQKSDKTSAIKPKKSPSEKEKQDDESNRLLKERKLKENVNQKRDKDLLMDEKENKSKKETLDMDKKQYSREKEKKEPEKEKTKKPVQDKESHEILKEKQTKKESEKLTQEKEGIDWNKKQKGLLDTEQKQKGKNADEILIKSTDKQKVVGKEIKSTKDIETANILSVDKNKAKEEASLKLKALRETENKVDHVKEKPKPVQTEEPKIKELNINQVKIRRPSHDDLILQLVKLKQTDKGEKRERRRRISEFHIPLNLIADHTRDHKCIKLANCAICNDSELELDIEEIILNKAKTIEINDIIIGQKIFKHKQTLNEETDGKQTFPLFMSIFNDDFIDVPAVNTAHTPEQLERKQPPSIGKHVRAEPEQPKGVIRYALSDRTFIEKGWTMLPTEKVVRKMNVYRMRPAHPEFDWFEHNKDKKIMRYDTGEKLAEFDDDGRCRIHYRSGRVALDYYNAEEINAQQRFVIHSSGEPDERGCSRPLAILATFDYLGNGIVFDHTGKIRLKYNQTEGVVLDRNIGPVSHWKWHTLNDPPVLQQVMIDTQMAHKDPDILKLGGPLDSKSRPDNEEMLAIEFDNFIKEKSKKLSQKFKPFQIKMKALKINEHFSLKVLDQATIYLIFRDGSTNIKLNLGMILNHQEIVDTDTAEVGEVSNSLERFPARTDSLAGLQNSIAFAQRVERARVERERRLRPTQPCLSSDKLTAAISRPRVPLRTVASESTVGTCKCRRPPSNNLYYDTRLV